MSGPPGLSLDGIGLSFNSIYMDVLEQPLPALVKLMDSCIVILSNNRGTLTRGHGKCWGTTCHGAVVLNSYLDYYYEVLAKWTPIGCNPGWPDSSSMNHIATLTRRICHFTWVSHVVTTTLTYVFRTCSAQPYQKAPVLIFFATLLDRDICRFLDDATRDIAEAGRYSDMAKYYSDVIGKLSALKQTNANDHLRFTWSGLDGPRVSRVFDGADLVISSFFDDSTGIEDLDGDLDMATESGDAWEGGSDGGDTGFVSKLQEAPEAV